jgi:hypothetical protein
MKKMLSWFVVLCACAILFAGCQSETTTKDESGSKNEKSDEREYMILDKDVFKIRKKGPVKFSHDAHMDEYGLACTDCHHDYQNGKNVWTEDDEVKTCETCHDPVETRGTVYNLQKAFHSNCKGCHKEVNEGEGKEVAPFKCSGCHEKKKP